MIQITSPTSVAVLSAAGLDITVIALETMSEVQLYLGSQVLTSSNDDAFTYQLLAADIVTPAPVQALIARADSAPLIIVEDGEIVTEDGLIVTENVTVSDVEIVTEDGLIVTEDGLILTVRLGMSVNVSNIVYVVDTVNFDKFRASFSIDQLLAGRTATFTPDFLTGIEHYWFIDGVLFSETRIATNIFPVGVFKIQLVAIDGRGRVGIVTADIQFYPTTMEEQIPEFIENEVSLILEPSVLELATGIEGEIRLGGNIFLQGVVFGYFPSRFTLINATTYPNEAGYVKVSGSNNVYDAPIIGTQRIPRRQSWRVEMTIRSNGQPQSMLAGVLDNFNRFPHIELSNYPPSSTHFFKARDFNDATVVDITATPLRLVAVASDGVNLSFYRQLVPFGELVLVHAIAIPADVTDFRLYYNMLKVGTRILFAGNAFFDSNVPITTDKVTIVKSTQLQLVSQTASAFRVKSLNAGDYSFQATAIDAPVSDSTTVQVRAFFFRPKFGDCGQAVLFGQLVEMETNAIGGTIEATGGTPLPLAWIAPYQLGNFIVIYTVAGQSLSCNFNVVPELFVGGIEDGYYKCPLMQGEQIIFTSNAPDAFWECRDHNIITAEGEFYAPDDAKDEYFGYKEVVIRVTGYGQTKQFIVIIEPMFPTPFFGGAQPIKWVQSARGDYNQVRFEKQSQDADIKNLSVEPLFRWKVSYDGLFIANDDCIENRDSSYLKSAQRLDAFIKLVDTTNHRFSMIDYHTGIKYKSVRFEDADNDQVFYTTQQQRDYEFAWVKTLC